MCGMQMCQLIRILEDDKVHIWFGLGKERETRGLSHKLVIRYNTTSHQTKGKMLNSFFWALVF